MLVKLIEVYTDSAFGRRDTSHFGDEFSLREVYINPKHVVCLREDSALKERAVKSNLLKELDGRQEFTKVIIDRGQNGMELVVVGDVSSIELKLNNGEEKNVLKG